MITVGLGIIYLASLLQDPPFTRPKTLHVSDRPYFQRKPDEIVLSAAGSYLYMSSIWVNGEYPDKNGIKRGTSHHTVGVKATIKQSRAPLELFRSNSKVIEAEAHWEELFEHNVNGMISHVSKYPDQFSPPDASGKAYFAVMYQEIEGEDVKNIVRVYFTPPFKHNVSDYGTFNYNEIVLPGSTWISTFSLEDGMLIYTRDPDQYYFRTLPLPPAVFSSHQSGEPKRIIASAGVEGKVMRGLTQPTAFSDYDTMIVRIHAPSDDALRVAALRTFKLSDHATLNVTIMDNLTSIDTIIDIEKEINAGWVLRERADMRDSQQFHEDYSPMNDNPYYQPDKIVKMPKLAVARSKSLKTLMYPFKSYLMSVDYVDDYELLELSKKWMKVVGLWKSQSKAGMPGGVFVDSNYNEDIIVPYVEGNYEQEFVGAALNNDGNICVAWTDFNNLFIYKRGLGQANWTAHKLQDQGLAEEEKSKIAPHVIKVLDMRWGAPWGITWYPGHARSVGVASVEIWNATQYVDVVPENILLVAMKDGRVHSFDLENTEEKAPAGFTSFLTQQLGMLIMMLGTIALFVINEVKNYPTIT
ncbi:unnamed protein product [Umbelopsis ramanniana]